MPFDWNAPLPDWDKIQKPYAQTIKNFEENSILQSLTKEHTLKKLCKRMKKMLRNRDYEYLDPVISALEKLISYDHNRHKIMEKIIKNVRLYAEKNIRERLVIKW